MKYVSFIKGINRVNVVPTRARDGLIVIEPAEFYIAKSKQKMTKTLTRPFSIMADISNNRASISYASV